MDVTKIELEFITQDNTELLALILNVGKSFSAPELSLALSPFIALITEESFRYLTAPARRGLGSTFSTPLFDSFAEVVTKLRARAKLFDDNRGGLEGLVETLTVANEKSSNWFLSPHQGLLGGIKRRLQPDLGIYYSDKHVICTTHTALLTVGFTHDRLLALNSKGMEEVGRFAYELSVAIGTYFRHLSACLEERGYCFDLSLTTKLPEVTLLATHTDHHGHLVYKHVTDYLELNRPEISMAIMFLVAQVNFVKEVLRHFLAPNSTLLLRSSFMTAYHATRALQELEGLGESLGQLSKLSQDILNEPDTNFMLSAHQVRNILAHYELRNAKRFLTGTGDPLDDALLGLCHQGRMEVAEIAQRQLSRMSEAFAEVISKVKLKDSRALLGDHT